jgi:C-terminal processing protease CtpA/Prc
VNDQLVQGLPVICLMPGSAAERAGVRCGDRVLIANGHRVETLMEYVRARNVYADRLELTLQRGQQILDMVLVFDQPDGAPRPTAQA